MILDVVGGLGRYGAIHRLFPEAARFLARADLLELEDGHHKIRGEELYAIVMRANGKPAQDAQLEVHDRYIDIQVVLEGVESMGWKPRAACRSAVAEFDAEKDYQLFKDMPEAWVQVHPGQCAVFFPEDAHAPLVSPGAVHKIVVKVAANAG